MFRKILIAVVASLALLSPLALPAQSDAHGVRGHRTVAHRDVQRSAPYSVYYRTCSREAWRVAGSYGCRADALRAAQNLHGCETFVR
jgi:hypothetical protein